MNSLVALIGVCAGLLIGVLLLETVPAMPRGKAAKIIEESLKTLEEQPKGLRRAVAFLDRPVSKWSPERLLSRLSADLYWAQLAGQWQGWTPVELLSLRLVAAAAGGIAGLVAFGDFLLGGAVAFLAWMAPAMLVSRVGRRERRRFQAEFPEYIQLLAAQAAVGISLEEALRRTSSSGGAVAKWVGQVLQASQGRSLFVQLAREARKTQLPELVSFAIQLEYVSRGLSQQDLLDKLARSVASDYLSQAEARAERVGSELVIPMVLFYFLPFVVTTLAIIGWPIVASLGR
jgi:Flp pilus assembly protein TadB